MKRENSQYPVWALRIALVILAVWLIGLLPPVLERLSLTGAAKSLRSAYRLLCHGIPERCIVLFDRPSSVCVRCTGIYLSIFTGCALVYPLLRRRIAWRSLIASAVAATAIMSLEWLLELTGTISPSPFLQAATGSVWGMGLSLLLCSSIDRIKRNSAESETR